MHKHLPRGLAVAGLAGLAILGPLSLPAADDPPTFSDWSAPVNLGPIVNSSASDAGAFVSKDGLSLYFGSTRPGGYGGFDLWVSQRATVHDPWGSPKNLGPTINTSGNEQTPTLSLDGHRLYFASSRPGGFGGLDLYVSRRHNKRDDLGWRLPVNLGSGVNSSAAERGPAPFEDDETGSVTLYFSSNRPGGLGGEDIYASTLQPDETYGPSEVVPELSSPLNDAVPEIRRDGLEMFLAAQPTAEQWPDLWVSTRESTSDPWSTPVNLGYVVNSADYLDFRPALSFDGRALYFHSDSARGDGWGDYDLYVTTRTRLGDED